MLGNTSGDRVTLSLSDVYHRGLRLLGFGAVTEDEVDAAVRACLDEGMRSPRATEFGLDDLAGAWAAQESRRTVGKVLVRP
jgi:NADPH:quinone reductase-like Zn-dependent oxidoreductase